MTAPFEQSQTGATPPLSETNPSFQPAQCLPNLNLVAERAGQIAKQLVGDPHDAADITQRVLVGVWQRYTRNGPPTDPVAYLGTSVRNGVSSHGRNVQRTTRHETSLDEKLEFSDAAEPLFMLRARATSIPEQIDARETLDEVTSYWPLLTGQQRDFLSMSIEGSRPAEIADCYGVGPNLVSACLKRARHMLRTLVKLSSLDPEELTALLNDPKTDRALVKLYRRKQLLDEQRQRDKQRKP